VYDPLGRRIAKQRLGDDGVKVWDQVDFAWAGVTLAEESHVDWRSRHDGAAGGRTTVWTWEPEGVRPVSQHERVKAGIASRESIDEQFYMLVTDLVGTPTELISPAGDVAASLRATIWGVSPRIASDVECAIRFPGQYYDEETQLHYNVLRYYDPIVARYNSGDPTGLAGGFNPQGFVTNPLRFIDPLGLMSCPVYTVYTASRSGQLVYVGISRNFPTRALFHALLGRTAAPIPGLPKLTKDAARGVEQILIDHHGRIQGMDGLPKVGSAGTAVLENVINSTSFTRTDVFTARAQVGWELLKKAGYPF